MKKALIILDKVHFDKVYPKSLIEKIAQSFDLLSEPLSLENYLDNMDHLEETNIIFSGWGAPKFDKAFLDKTPNLEAIFYAAGTMKTLLTDAVWERGMTVSTAITVNAIPVAEYTLSQILFTLKNGWSITRQVKKERGYAYGQFDVPGSYMRTVGLISLSQVGRKTLEFLKPFDMNVIFYDPFVSEKEGLELGARKVTLEEIFTESDVVSLHSPWLPETEQLIRGHHLKNMRENATFINTARGAIVHEEELIEVMKERKDLTAILDVTYPEPPVKNSLLFDLDNIVVTPHIAGSTGSEVMRLGFAMYEEAIRYISNEPLKYKITKESYEIMS